MMARMLCLFGLGCTVEEYRRDIQVESTFEVEDTAYMVDIESIQAPDLSEIEAVLQQGILSIREVRASQVLDLYDEYIAQGDADCPRWYFNDNGHYWADTCVSDVGIHFQGFGTSIPWDNQIDDYGNTWSGRQIHCEGKLKGSTDELICQGGLNQLRGVDANGAPIFYSYTSPYEILDPNQEFVFPTMEMWAVNHPDYKAIFYDAIQKTETGIVQFDRQTLNNVGCILEPNGAQNIQVLPIEEWVFIQWQGDIVEDGSGETICDGCGDAYFEGQYIGQVCADFSPWLSWTTSPFD